jgi:hypothetical protein
VRELIGDPVDQLALLGSSRRRCQAALSRSYMNRKNLRGAVMAATLRLADARLLAGVTLVVFPRCLIGRWQAQNATPGDEQRSKRTTPDRRLRVRLRPTGGSRLVAAGSCRAVRVAASALGGSQT